MPCVTGENFLFTVCFVILHFIICVGSWGSEAGTGFDALGFLEDTSAGLELTHDGETIRLCISEDPFSEFYQHSCMKRCHTNSCIKSYIKISGYCQCDVLCLEYNDCCFDYEHRCLKASFGSDNDTYDIPIGEDDYDLGTADVPYLISSLQTTTLDANIDGYDSHLGATDVPIRTSPLWTDWYWTQILSRTGKRSWDSVNCIQPISDGNAYLLEDRCSVQTPTSYLCTQSSSSSDPLTYIPVLGLDNLHYKNVFCALCNGLDNSKLKLWHLRLDSCAISQLVNILVYQNFILIAQKCDVTINFQPSSPYERQPRVCTGRTTCKSNGKESLSQACGKYSAPITINNTVFKNPHCAKCMGWNTSVSDTCHILHSDDILNEVCTFVQPNPKVSIFFDFIDGGIQIRAGADVLVRSNLEDCETTEIFDPFLGRCRRFTCPNNFEISDDKCIIKSNFSHSTSYFHISILLMSRSFAAAQRLFDGRILETLQRNYSIVMYNFSSNNTNSTELVPLKNTCVGPDGIVSRGSFSMKRSSFEQFTEVAATVINVVTGSLSHCMPFEDETDVGLLVDVRVANYDTYPNVCFANNQQMIPIINVTTFSNGSVSFRANDDANGYHNITLDDVFSEVSVSRRSEHDSWAISENSYLCQPKLSCQLVTLNSSEFTWVTGDKQAIRHLGSDTEISFDNFIRISDTSVQLCKDVFDSVIDKLLSNKRNSISEARRQLAIVGISISVLFLALVVATYVTFSELRNVPGKIVMSLSSALLLAQLLFLLGIPQTDVKDICLVIALLMHYLWLSTFFWTNVLAFDLGCTFGSKSGKRNLELKYLFVKYSLYAWGVPCILVAMAVLLHFTLSLQGKREHVYDLTESCWLQRGNSLLIAFSVPLLCLLLGNGTLFTYTIIGIQRTRHAARVLGDIGRRKQSKKDLNLSIRLSIIIGLPWFIGFSIPFTDLGEVLQFVFLALMLLQGPVIFVSFVCNKRAIGMWRTKLCNKNAENASKKETNVNVLCVSTKPNNDTSSSL